MNLNHARLPVPPPGLVVLALEGLKPCQNRRAGDITVD